MSICKWGIKKDRRRKEGVEIKIARGYKEAKVKDNKEFVRNG